MSSRRSNLGANGRKYASLLAFIVASSAMSCGYHVAGHAANLPSEWQTIAVPAFKNDTTRYRIEQRFTQSVIRQFLQRTKYKIVQNAEEADAVLHGEVLTIETNPMIFNATTGQVTMMLVTVHTKVLLVDNKTQKVVYKNDDMVFRDEYQISTDARAFFEEQDPALERMARDFAAQLVSNVVESF
ncbi:MAG TPA: LPS assembly lipoprotein LptE [Candidatus Acidoferrales bacterium]|nr:LPS assembly lipoprotein LptE [Candidatus Acidoferrales bacterium]